jgi:hypothetical protein
MKGIIACILAGLSFSFSVSAHQNHTRLTGILNDQCDIDGNSYQLNFWNTYSNDFVWNIFFTLNSGVAGPFINGPDDTNAGPVSVDLSLPGTYTFVMYATAPGSLDHTALNLFFNDDNVTPRTSAKTTVNAIGAFSTNDAMSTYPLAPNNFFDTVPAANALSFIEGNNQVTLVDYKWYDHDYSDTDLPMADRVSPFLSEPDGSLDLRGIFTLTVTPVVRPALSIAKTITNSLVISWPYTSVDFSLYENPNVDGTNWTLVETPPLNDGSNKVIIINSPADKKFYRLIEP